MELYLDRRDLLGDDFACRIAREVATLGVPADFVWIVEAPTRTLDGRYFDLTADTPDSRETLRRVAEVGRRIGAVAANVHVVAPTTVADDLTPAARVSKLAATRPLLDVYVGLCRDAGLVPQVENIPPVGRMREAAYVFSFIGLTASDLETLARWYPPLGLTVDTSHAALYLNWRRVPVDEVEPRLRPIAEFCRGDDEPVDLPGYLRRLADRITAVHVSNAAGLLGEGLGYAGGPEDLDAALAPLAGTVPYFVTETLEADDARAVGMRAAQERLRRLCADRTGGWT
jgi:sugar phosphate isomerase/epimerase